MKIPLAQIRKKIFEDKIFEPEDMNLFATAAEIEEANKMKLY
jgi:hypothetical protein